MTHLLFAEGKFLEVISVNFWQMIISVLNLVILYLILKKFLFKPVKRTLEKRRQQVDDLYGSAEAAKAEAESAKVEYTAKLDRADESARKIVSDATRRANERAEEIVDEAKSEADRLRRRADEEIAQEKKKALNEIKNDISDISVEIAEKVVGREIREEDHREMIDSFIRDLEDENRV